MELSKNTLDSIKLDIRNMITKIVNKYDEQDLQELDYRHALMLDYARYVADFKDVTVNWSEHDDITPVPYDMAIHIEFLKPVVAYCAILVQEFGVGRNMTTNVDALLDICFTNYNSIGDEMYNDVLDKIGQFSLESLTYACKMLAMYHEYYERINEQCH